jgi:hypothetical protein
MLPAEPYTGQLSLRRTNPFGGNLPTSALQGCDNDVALLLANYSTLCHRYTKSDKADLTAAERSALRAIAAEIRSELI